MRIEEYYSLEKHNTFHLPVKTRWFMEYGSEEELRRILHDEYFHACASLHIGSGSNLLFLGDYNGIVLHSAIKGLSLTEETRETVSLRIGAAERWDDVVAYAVSRGWYGIENLSGIPGECGAAAVQNIGAYGMEIKDVVEEVEAYDRNTCEKHTFTRETCRYAYRYSRFREEDSPCILTHIRIRLAKTPRFVLGYGDLQERMANLYPGAGLPDVRRTILTIRKEKLPDPEQTGNAGSFFMNPLIPMRHFEALQTAYPGIPSFAAEEEGYVKIPAAWLIEQCGFKGKTQGEAGVYEKHPLILINTGNACGSDIARLAESIREAVAMRFHIGLVPEVKYIG
ncbi:MAG: UDP-N-acetylmuramate dehydrogenase [Tannerellaceae bacterium]|jgi:UDP-N-acetylmuramate dehydrogenase|nr:UDP-N-acetylmuramate dehydrogenase [Tannerellaceae bacterium]